MLTIAKMQTWNTTKHIQFEQRICILNIKFKFTRLVFAYTQRVEWEFTADPFWSYLRCVLYKSSVETWIRLPSTVHRPQTRTNQGPKMCARGQSATKNDSKRHLLHKRERTANSFSSNAMGAFVREKTASNVTQAKTNISLLANYY